MESLRLICWISRYECCLLRLRKRHCMRERKKGKGGSQHEADAKEAQGMDGELQKPQVVAAPP